MWHKKIIVKPVGTGERDESLYHVVFKCSYVNEFLNAVKEFTCCKPPLLHPASWARDLLYDEHCTTEKARDLLSDEHCTTEKAALLFVVLGHFGQVAMLGDVGVIDGTQQQQGMLPPWLKT